MPDQNDFNDFNDLDQDNFDLEPEYDRQEEKNRRTRRRTRQFLGLAVAILVVVGAVSIIRSGIDLAGSLVNDVSEYEEYNVRIAPFVWFDVLPFKELDAANQTAVKQAVIWGVMNQLGNDNIGRNERGEPQIPAIEIDRYSAALFGPDYKFEHASFSDPVEGMEYVYDPATEIYTVPATGLTPYYYPSVVEFVRESGGVRKVVVGYVSAIGSNDELIATPDYDHPYKYMDYYFYRDGNEYYLYAILQNDSYEPPVIADSSSLPASSALPSSSLLPDSSSLPPGSSSASEGEAASNAEGEGGEESGTEG